MQALAIPRRQGLELRAHLALNGSSGCSRFLLGSGRAWGLQGTTVSPPPAPLPRLLHCTGDLVKTSLHPLLRAAGCSAPTITPAAAEKCS